MQTLSQETTLEYVIEAGVSVVWPPATKRALWVKSPSIFMSNIMWQCISWYPMSKPLMLSVCTISGPPPSHFWKAMHTFFISFLIACLQWSIPISQSICRVCSTDLGISMPNLCDVLQYFVLSLLTIWFLLCKTSGTHQTNASSS